MGSFLWIGARQLQAARDQVVWAIGGDAIPHHTDLPQWIADQGMVWARDPSRTTLTADLTAAIQTHGLSQPDAATFATYMNTSAHTIDHADEAEYGLERGGGGWLGSSEFVIRAGVVLALGALEQFERDVLRILLYHRPAGLLGSRADNATTKASVQDLHKDCALWNWFDTSARERSPRREVFKRVFNIILLGGADEERLQQLYKVRHNFAHGRSSDKVTLSDFVDALHLTFRAMHHLAEEARMKQLIEI